MGLGIDDEVGARPFLVAFNVYLGPATNVAVAKEVAKKVRACGGGLPCVKGLGLEVDGQAQVSMNLTDTDTTPIWRAYEAVKAEAAARGVETWAGAGRRSVPGRAVGRWGSSAGAAAKGRRTARESCPWRRG